MGGNSPELNDLGGAGMTQARMYMTNGGADMVRPGRVGSRVGR